MIKQTPILLAAMTLFLGAGILPAHAQSTSAATSGQTGSQYGKSAGKQCDTLTGDQKEACLKRAETDKNAAGNQAQPETSQSETGQAESGTDDNGANAQGDAAHDAAIEKCNGLSGEQQKKCEADAKTHSGE